MAYQLLPNLILLLSILGIFILVLRRLPEASNLDDKEAAANVETSLRMVAKGLPAKAASRSRAVMAVVMQRVWHFMLEAKGLRQGPAVNYRIKKMWQRKPVGPMRNEAFYLEQIKHFPKDLEQYNRLGQYYLDQKNFEEARNVFEYLTKHAPANSDYLAKLGYTQLRLQEFPGAVASYSKALGLDPSHPNRYYNLALAHTSLREWAPALAALKKAVALEPSNQKYQQMLAETRRKISQS